MRPSMTSAGFPDFASVFGRLRPTSRLVGLFNAATAAIVTPVALRLAAAPILAASLVTVCGVAHVLLRS